MSSKQFCEEDIDQILERRTQTIRHDNSAEKGSIFSKASFATNTTDDIDINDPDFWDKVAQKAQFELVEEIDENHLIIYEPRQRKQVARFGGQDGEISDMGSEDEGYNEQKKARPVNLNEPKAWTLTEKTRFERCLMLFGFAGWDTIVRKWFITLLPLITCRIVPSSLR
jgi:hypothetical protein